MPPPLDGVGDKINKEYLAQIFNTGADDRPYMRVAMPKFGGDKLATVHAALIALDEKTAAPEAKFEEPESRIKSTGRHLVGEAASRDHPKSIVHWRSPIRFAMRRPPMSY